MGRQVNFYMLCETEKKFIEFVKNSGNISIYLSRSDTPVPIEITALPEPFSIPYGYLVYFFNRDVSKVLRTRFVEKQQYYLIDSSESSVIEFSRCALKSNKLREGRIWIEPHRVVCGKFVKKEPEFITWYKTIERWVKKNFIKREDRYYIAPDVEKWISKGGKLIYSYQKIDSIDKEE